jgi:hypothetical protein
MMSRHFRKNNNRLSFLWNFKMHFQKQTYQPGNYQIIRWWKFIVSTHNFHIFHSISVLHACFFQISLFQNGKSLKHQVPIIAGTFMNARVIPARSNQKLLYLSSFITLYFFMHVRTMSALIITLHSDLCLSI